MKYRHFPAAALAAGLLFCTLFSGLTAYADDKKGELTQKQTETRQEYEAAQSALEELQNEQTQTESEVAALTGQAAELAGQITAVTAAVQNAQTVLDERQAAADAARAALDAKQAEYDARLAVCREQLRAMQRLDGGGAVWLLAQAKSLYQLLTFDAVLQQMSARNSTVLAEPDPWGIPHRGTDFAAPGGTPIYAIADGVVSAARTMNSYGNCVQVSHGTADDGHRYDSLCAHMSSIAVAQGAAVQKGDLLGYVGNTGNVYGAGGGYHLHLELRVDGSRVDPLGFVPTPIRGAL